jgi:hypothetical protein
METEGKGIKESRRGCCTLEIWVRQLFLFFVVSAHEGSEANNDVFRNWVGQ